MNPYDFVPLDLKHPPEHHAPVWHAELARSKGQKVYSGHLFVYMLTETPLFIRDTTKFTRDALREDTPGQLYTHICNKDGEYIIPGSSIKGLLRSVVETLCGGCVSVFRVPKEYTHNPLPPDFAPCTSNAHLCLACRLFGMMGRREGKDGIDTFLGKVNIDDAYAFEESLAFCDPIYTAVLDAPKPRHRAFYLDQQGRYIAGRKYYFHHDGELRTENRLLEIRNKPGEYRNQHIQPLEREVEFSARIDFAQLEADELAALLLAITLLPDMRHKIGYGKPLGLGSIQLVPTNLTLIDYATRYSAFRAGRGMTSYNAEEVADLIDERWSSLDPQISEATARFCSYPSLQDLQQIWRWPPDRSVDYCYPSQRWFKEHPQARIAATRDLYPGD